MSLLLDTHVFIWWDSDPSRLPNHVIAAITDPEAIVWLSAASVWEMCIKADLGKLTLRRPLDEILERQRVANNIYTMDVTQRDALATRNLPPVHKDPFDRLIAAQAMRGRYKLVSADDIFKRYPVDLFW